MCEEGGQEKINMHLLFILKMKLNFVSGNSPHFTSPPLWALHDTLYMSSSALERPWGEGGISFGAEV